MREKRQKAATPSSEPAPGEGAELPDHWRAQRKTERVLRLLRGEALDAVSLETCGIGPCGVPRPSLADYVRRPKATRGRTAAGAG